MDSKARFGLNVRRVRKERGFSQEELADRARLHRTYVGGVERGERNISLENILALAEALNTSAGELFVGIKSASRLQTESEPDRAKVPPTVHRGAARRG